MEEEPDGCRGRRTEGLARLDSWAPQPHPDWAGGRGHEEARGFLLSPPPLAGEGTVVKEEAAAGKVETGRTQEKGQGGSSTCVVARNEANASSSLRLRLSLNLSDRPRPPQSAPLAHAFPSSDSPVRASPRGGAELTSPPATPSSWVPPWPSLAPAGRAPPPWPGRGAALSPAGVQPCVSRTFPAPASGPGSGQAPPRAPRAVRALRLPSAGAGWWEQPPPRPR